MYSTRAWQRLSGRVLRAWRGQHGSWCPGYQRDAHPAADLTVDHVVPLAAGGAPFDIGNGAVLCRSCNATKGAITVVGDNARRIWIARWPRPPTPAEGLPPPRNITTLADGHGSDPVCSLGVAARGAGCSS